MYNRSQAFLASKKTHVHEGTKRRFDKDVTRSEFSPEPVGERRALSANRFRWKTIALSSPRGLALGATQQAVFIMFPVCVCVCLCMG